MTRERYWCRDCPDHPVRKQREFEQLMKHSGLFTAKVVVRGVPAYFCWGVAKNALDAALAHLVASALET